MPRRVPRRRLLLQPPRQAGHIRRGSCDPPFLIGKPLLRIEDGVSDSRIGAAAAQIAAHAFANAVEVVPGLAFADQPDRAHDLAWRAEPALEAIMRDKGGLDRVELVALGKAFDSQP